ncbi:hypothetical protein PR048_029944, partial [Dryococelus australis]
MLTTSRMETTDTDDNREGISQKRIVYFCVTIGHVPSGSLDREIHQHHVDQLTHRPANEEMSCVPAKFIEQVETVFRKSTNTDHRWGSKNVNVPGRPEQRLSESPFKGFPEASRDGVSDVAVERVRAAHDSGPPPLAVSGTVSVTDMAAALDMKVSTDNAAAPHNLIPQPQEGPGDHHSRNTSVPKQSTFTT